MERITLNDSERALAKRRPSKSLFVAIINFRGPRGRKYRPMRTAAVMTADLAREAAQDIRTRPYRYGAFATTTRVVEVDFIGRVKQEVQS